MKRIIGNDKQRGYVGEIGFGSFLYMANFEMNKALTLWLVDKFNCGTEALEFEGGISIPVRPLVKSVLDIPSGPIKVVEGPVDDEALYAQYSRNGRARNAKEVADEMCSITDKEPFCIAFMMAILGIYLAPNTSVEVNRALLRAVKQVDKLKDMDWCNFVATYLFQGIKDFKESGTSRIKGCVHILSVIFIDFVKHAAFKVPLGFPRLGVVTTEHIKWVVSHPFTSLMVCRPEESIYAAVLDNMPTHNVVEDGYCVDSETNTDYLANTFATTNTDPNTIKHPVSAELGTAMTSPNTTSLAVVEHVELGTSPRSAVSGSLAEQIGFQEGASNRSPLGLFLNRILDKLWRGCKLLRPDVSLGNKRDSASPMEDGDRSAKKARVECPGVHCYCTEPACGGFVGPPLALLGHLATLHSVPVHKINYGEEHRLQVSEKQCLLQGVGGDSVFLLAVGALGNATAVSVVCIRAAASPQPRYAVKLLANGPPPASSAAGRIKYVLEAVTSSTRPGKVVVEELPSYLTVPPTYLVGSGASKEVTLDIGIDKM